MSLSINYVRNVIRPNYWVTRRNEFGDFINDNIRNLQEGDNVMFGNEASEDDFKEIHDLARSLGLRLTAERECKNGVIQVWAIAS